MIAVFLGPSLARRRAEEILGSTEAVILPPAAQGDIYRCWRRRPRVIVLIDGYFSEVPSPWHKEILWVMSNNTPVIGASSMGALRAAELAAFGMVGVGEVFAGYRDGALVADDEVALLHGDADSDYVHFSVPLVDIRATLRRALRQQVITPPECERLLEAARNLLFPQRTYTAMIAACEDGPRLRDFTRWVRHNAFSQKARDAEAALALAVSDDCPRSFDPEWTFERTAMWDDLVRKHSNTVQNTHNFEDDDRIDALEKDKHHHHKLMTTALARLLAVDYAERSGRIIGDDDLMRALARLRREKGLETPDDLWLWMQENGLSIEGITYLLNSEVHLADALSAFASDVHPHLLDQMRIEGVYGDYGPGSGRLHPGNSTDQAAALHLSEKH